ncbi:hypothetical protein B0H13DRAFT_2550417 [Mycena leptocephala]|nr:hypothetical protein B0H13DRAFT_2550417 [Mycena leptocephala]
MSTTFVPAATQLSGAEDWPLFRVHTQLELCQEGVFTLLESHCSHCYCDPCNWWYYSAAQTAADALIAATAVTNSLSTAPTVTVTPATGGTTTLVAGPTPAPGIAFKDTPAERNSRALGIINKFLSVELCMEYVDETSAGTLWAKLRERFEEDNRADNAMGVLSSLFTTKLVVESEAELIDCSKIEAHIGIIKGYFDRLSQLKYAFSADLQPLIVLSTLPDDHYWTGIRGNIVSSLGTGMTWDKVCAHLLTLGKHPEPADESALAAKSQSSNKAKPSSSSGDKHCLKNLVQDSKKGKLKSGKRVRKRGSKANASAASDSDSEDEDSVHVASVSSKSYAVITAQYKVPADAEDPKRNEAGADAHNEQPTSGTRSPPMRKTLDEASANVRDRLRSSSTGSPPMRETLNGAGGRCARPTGFERCIETISEVDVFHSVTPYSNSSDAVAGPSSGVTGESQAPHNSQRYPESVTLAFTTPISTRPSAIAGASAAVTAPPADSTPPPSKWWDTFAVLNSSSTLRPVKLNQHMTNVSFVAPIKPISSQGFGHTLLSGTTLYPIVIQVETHAPLNNIFPLTALGVHDGDFVHFEREVAAVTLNGGRTYHRLIPTTEGKHAIRWFLHDSSQFAEAGRSRSLPNGWTDQILAGLCRINPFIDKLESLAQDADDTLALH